MKPETNHLNPVRNSVKFVFDALDVMREVRHKLELSLINQLRETVGTHGPLAESMQTNLDLINTFINDQHSLQRDISEKIKQAITGDEDIPIPPEEPKTRARRPAPPQGGGIRVSVRHDQSPVIVPITLRNHQGTPEYITMDSSPFREVGSAKTLNGHIRFEPPQMVLTSGTSALVQAVINVGPEFEQGKDYVAEIHIGGSNPQSLPVRFTVLPAD